MIRRDITGHGGTPLAVFEDGPEGAPEILFIHGWSQHHLSWERQAPLARDFRLILPDLRGHGASGRPEGDAHYNRSEVWADDIAAIVKACCRGKPVLVGWSMGSFVAGDYLARHGDGQIAGVCLIGAHLRIGQGMNPQVAAARAADTAASAQGMYSHDDAENLAATLAFVKACFHQPPEPDALARMVGFNMLVAPDVRRAARLRDADYHDAFAATRVPALVLWGARERLAPDPAGREVAETLQNARTLVYPDCGHSPFYEAPDRFNRDLAAFVRACQQPEDLS
ncbi:alpha/beta fold hydrolase [Marinibacterium profundimaris]|uniref:alpha/beta fold hydrolase n=1 Tax=Marinibacterium profundimaris TaxID=1679460 RepID=UPI000B52883F|nr:alpha/beta hydrolase [Marinibacterium profundimaris]